MDLNGAEIEVVPNCKYLGAFFTPKLSWNMTKDVLAKQAKKAVFSIYNLSKHFGYFKPNEAF